MLILVSEYKTINTDGTEIWYLMILLTVEDIKGISRQRIKIVFANYIMRKQINIIIITKIKMLKEASDNRKSINFMLIKGQVQNWWILLNVLVSKNVKCKCFCFTATFEHMVG